jgi:hypothetical protein
LTGADELALFGCDYAALIGWIAGALTGEADTLRAEDLPLLPLADGDRLIQALYRALFGDCAELRQPCVACGEPFEMSLPLDALTASTEEAGTEPERRLAGGTIIRWLQVGDLLASKGADPLIDRVVLARGGDSAAEIEAALESISPSAMETIETACAACHARQAFVFDLGRFFLRCSERERPILVREIHLLARTYGWGLADILSLHRATRHEFVRLAVASAAPRPRMVAA